MRRLGWGLTMSKRELIQRITTDDDDRIVLARVMDKIAESGKKNALVSTRFLNLHQQALVSTLLVHEGNPRHAFSGGFDTAERRVLLLLPDYMEEIEEEDLPFAAIRARFHPTVELSHRDFLGSLMGIGIKRETVGDILVGERSCDMLVLKEVLPFLLSGFESVGRTAVTVAPISLTEVTKPEEKTTVLTDTVASLRLDAIAAIGFSLSREKAADAIRAGKMFVNSSASLKPERLMSVGDVVSMRGFGKFQMDVIGGQSRKGRTFISLRVFG